MTSGATSRRAFLHVGLPKTGTTYLQHVLWGNKDALAERGVLLPGPTRRRHLLASLEVREDPKLARRAGDVREPWRRLVEECRGWSGDVVISHEFFGAASSDQVRRIVGDLEGFEVHVVLTARAMPDLGLSRWQEWVKSGGTLPVDEYPRRARYDPTDEWGWGSFDLAEVLDRWGAVLPAHHIHVLPIAPGRGDPADLWHRFADVIGLDATGLEVPTAPANTSLGVVEVELLRRVNPHLHDFKSAADRGNWIRGFLAEGDILPRRREKFRAGEDKQKELVDRGLRALSLLRENGFDVRGDLDALEPRTTEGLRHPREVTDAEMLDSAVLALANMLRVVRTLTDERDDLRRRAQPQGITGATERLRRWWSHHRPPTSTARTTVPTHRGDNTP